MPTVASQSEDRNIECFYDSSVEKDKFFLTIKNFDELMRAAGAIRGLE